MKRGRVYRTTKKRAARGADSAGCPPRLPRAVKIFGRTWRISTCQPWDDSSDIGECDTLNGEIRIARDVAQDVAELALVHELLHAVIDSAGAERQFDSVDAEEDLVYALSPALLSLLRDNALAFSKGGK